MVGGGNFARGSQLAVGGIQRVTADYIGMLGTLMNALALNDIFNSNQLDAVCLSNVFAEQVAKSFSHRQAQKDLRQNRVLIIAGGIGRPYLTTDTAAVSLALELDCEVVLKATKVSGVYDKDPIKYKDAKIYQKLSANDAVNNQDIRVMDKAAMGLAYDHKLPIIVFDLMQEGNILKAALADNIGTTIEP